MLVLAALFFAVTLAETLALGGLFWLAFRLLGARRRSRALWSLPFSYPGLLSMGGGTVGFAVPVPLLLGAPVWLVTLARSTATGTGWLIWRPALLLAAESEVSFELVLALEIAALCAWLLVVLVVVVYVWRRSGGGDLDPATSATRPPE